MSAAATGIPWADLRAEYVRNGAQSLKVFAEQHDVPYDSLRRRAKREGWQRLRRLQFARQRVRECEAGLAFARRVAGSAAEYVGRLSRATGLSLDNLAVDAWQAHFAVSELWSAALRLSGAQRALAALEAGRDPETSCGGRPMDAESADGDGASAWPMFNVLAYRERGPAAVPRRLTPAKLAIPFRRRRAA